MLTRPWHLCIDDDDDDDDDDEVGVVSAADGDGPPYDRFRLHVLNAAAVDTTDDAFSVDERTGRLVTLLPLDRELRSVHRLTLVARDDHPPHFTSTANVTVRVLDRNDNAPMIAGADSRHVVGVLAFSVAAQSAGGHLVGVIHAVDPDAGSNARLHWSIAAGDDWRLFVLDELTGHLTVGPHTDLSAIDVDYFQLSVLVSDDGLPPKSTFVQVSSHNYYFSDFPELVFGRLLILKLNYYYFCYFSTLFVVNKDFHYTIYMFYW